MKKIEFRKIQESDISKIHEWRNKPHMKFWDKDGISLEKVEKKYESRITGMDICKCYIASYEGDDFGLIQYYKNIDEPDYCKEVGISDGASIDLFIGDEKFLGKGLGKLMLGQFIHKIFIENSDINIIYICHENKNIPAIKCSQSIGFIFEKDVVENNKPSKLFKIER